MICLGTAFAILWNLLEEKKIKNLLSSSIILLIIIITVFINLIPYIMSVHNGIEPQISGSRSHRDVEYYSLKFIQLILPIQGHRISAFANLRAFYDNNISIMDFDSKASSLGLYMSIGLIVSLFIAMKRNLGDNDNIFIKNSAILNIFILLLGSVGGISSLIAIFSPIMRTYNRLSVFIAFYSLFIVSYYFGNLLLKVKLQKTVFFFIIIFYGIAASADLVSSHAVQRNYYLAKYYSDKHFIKQIEEVTPPGSMVFQLPHIPSNYHQNFRNIGFYEQYVPFIHSTSLKWTYRAQLNSSAEKWQMAVSQKSTEDMMKHLAGVNFKGLYIDMNGFTNENYDTVINDIIKITNVEPIISNDRRLLYFYLGEYLAKLKETFNAEELKIYSYW
jgi:phosphoglycerol transferase